MAATWTFIKGTPYSAVYHITSNDGQAGTIDYTPTMAGQLATGPLKRELAKLAATASLDTLNLPNASARVRTYLPTAIAATQSFPAGIAISVAWTTTGMTATLPLRGGETSVDLYIEIRLVHSKKR